MAAKLSGPGGGKFDVEQNHEINVTPFVDVMLVLLIIFMVAAPLASVNVKVNLPPANVEAADQAAADHLRLDQGERRPLRRRQPDRPQRASGRPEAGGGPEPRRQRIFIRGDEDVEYGKFLDVMNTMQDNGFYSVALVGEDRSGVGAKK